MDLPYVGNGTKAVIITKVALATPVISRIYAYPVPGPRGSRRLALHIMSDDGVKNTVVPKLCARVEPAMRTVYERECTFGLEQWTWSHTSSYVTLPPRAQLIYVRPIVTGERVPA